MRMIDNIHVIAPPHYMHYQAFDEAAESFHSALCELGHDTTLITSMHRPNYGRSLVFGAHLRVLGESVADIGPDDIIFQSEQICERSEWMTKAYFDMLKSHEVWDYSLQNIKALSRHGIHALHCPIGYMPCMQNIAPETIPDSFSIAPIDVLFIGSICPRRDHILKALDKAGVKTLSGFSLYGERRNDLIAQAKIVLNMHYYDSAIHEIFRTSHLMANRKCIVSETGKDAALEAPYREGMQWSDYDDIVKDCLTLLENDGARETIANRGHALFSARRQTDILKGLV